MALYGDTVDMSSKSLGKLEEMMEKPFSQLDESELKMLDEITVSSWDLINSNSGGHKCITNISGLNYLGRSTRPPQSKYKYDPEKEDAAYVKFIKMLQKELVRILKEKIAESGSERYEPEFEIEVNESIKRITKSQIKSMFNKK
jgi:hypothetical protein